MLRSRRCGGHEDEKGQALLEFALVLPLLVLLLFGIAEFGRMLGVYLSLQHAAREGARLAVTGASDYAVTERIIEAGVLLDPSRTQITIGPPQTNRFRGDTVRISITYTFPVETPVIGQVVGGEVPLAASLAMRME